VVAHGELPQKVLVVLVAVAVQLLVQVILVL
jgi:hypothetical protein